MGRTLLSLKLSLQFDTAYEAAGHLDDVINLHGFKNSIMLNYLDGYVVLACE